MRHVGIGFLLTIVILAAPVRLVAQRQSALIPRGYAVGFTGGLWVIAADGGIATPVVTMHLSGLHPGAITAEFALGIAPLVALEGALLLQPDLDLAYNIALPGMTVLASAGASALVLPEAGGLASTFGVNAGLSALARTGHRSGVRVGGFFRPLFSPDGITETISFEIGLTSLPEGGL
jgi:hypothetical protein